MDRLMDSVSNSDHSNASTTGALSTDNERIKYMNLNFVDNSESSSQPKDTLTDFSRIQNSTSKITAPFHGTEVANPTDTGKTQAVGKSLADMGFRANEADGWENLDQPPKENLYKLLRKMIEDNTKPNVQIRIGSENFNCHMLVLQCYSDFFMDLSTEVLVELPAKKITPRAFMMVYDWMLTDEPSVQREGILELFNAANFLGIKDLISQCWFCLDDDIRFREDTAFLLYLEARGSGLESVCELMLSRICKFFLTLVASNEFLSLNVEEICTLLSSNAIGVNSEMEIFMSAVRWLSHDWLEREKHLLDVIKCVRFNLMPTLFLLTLTKNMDSSEIDRIVVYPEVQKMISDGISYTAFQSHYGDKRDEFMYFLESQQLEAPMQRQIIYDKECNYHHCPECPNRRCITYRSFLDYLQMIQAIGKDYWRSLEMIKDMEKSMSQCCPHLERR